MAIRNTGTGVALAIDERVVVATACCSQRAVAGGDGTRIFSRYPAVEAVMISCERVCGMAMPVARARVRCMG